MIAAVICGAEERTSKETSKAAPGIGRMF
jgi:hypothetical protein